MTFVPNLGGLALLFAGVIVHTSLLDASQDIRQRAWETPGCHLVGNTREVRIPGCMPFRVTTNACRGYCVSYAIPSPYHTLAINSKHIITSRAECCSMVDTHDVSVSVPCREGTREITFKSALSCACSICRRYQ